MKNMLFKALSVFMLILLVFNISVSSFAASKSELQDQLADIQEEREEKQELLDSLKGDLDKQEEYVTTLYSQIEAFQKEIDLYQIKINTLNMEVADINKKMADAEVQMSDKKAEIAEIKDALAVRIRASYMAGDGSTLKLLLGSDNLASYLTTSEMLKRIADNDEKIIKLLVANMSDLLKLQRDFENQKEKLEVKKKDLEEEQKVFTDKQFEISLKYDEANELLSTLDKESQAYKNQIAALDRQESQLEQQIQNIITGSGGTGGAGTNYAPSNNPSGYINPVPYSDRYISSVYGMRTNPVTGVYKLHAGIDISCGGAGGKTGPFTKKIVAAKAGTVSYAGWVSGYGNTVMITHSDGYLTLYAHNYTINVSVGQQVSQGQQIAIMGDTGNSGGAHCHFEIRNGMWGTTMDPAPYI